jgi:hypothetical protein
MHAIKACGEVELAPHILKLDTRGERSASRSCRFVSGKKSAIAIIQSAERAPRPIWTLLETRISYFLQESEDSFVVRHLA